MWRSNRIQEAIVEFIIYVLLKVAVGYIQRWGIVRIHYKRFKMEQNVNALVKEYVDWKDESRRF